ncbi:MAG: 50S ribosomal protein L11 methyltransferase [Tissierellia bacterium]|nr:50S ribosomal protein L11 methyltransferase [Tissierellia bacterium]
MIYEALTIKSKDKKAWEVQALLSAYGIDQFEESSRQLIQELNRPDLAWDYVDPDLIDLEEGDYQVTFYLAEDQDKSFLEDLKRDLEDRGLGELLVDQVQEEDWANNWKKYYKPIDLNESLALVPSWEDYEPKEGQEVLYIDPGMAFGSGTHETTYMCMEEVYDLVQEGDRVIDIGCGSGILSLVALKKGAQEALGVDIDPVCITASRNNSRLNGLEDRFKLFEGNLLDVVEGEAQVIVSNIVAEIIVTMIGDLRDHLKLGGYFITSGIILDKKDLVVSELENQGFEVLRERTKGEWVALVAKRTRP